MVVLGFCTGRVPAVFAAAPVDPISEPLIARSLVAGFGFSDGRVPAVLAVVLGVAIPDCAELVVLLPIPRLAR